MMNSEIEFSDNFGWNMQNGKTNVAYIDIILTKKKYTSHGITHVWYNAYGMYGMACMV